MDAVAGSRPCGPGAPEEAHLSGILSIEAGTNLSARIDAGVSGKNPEGSGMKSFLWYFLAAIAEIAGCFAFWAWLRLGKGANWIVPGMFSLVFFAVVLTRIDTAWAGRAYAAYGGVYIAASLLWMWLIEQKSPDRWDCLGAMVCLAGAAVVLWGPRGQ